MHVSRRRLATAAAGSLALSALPALPARAQPLPDTARILAGFAPGGTVDVTARRVGDRLRDVAAKSVIVENRTGAGGQIALSGLKTAAPDGTTIALTPMSMLGIYPHTYRKLPYDPVTGFAPVGTVVVAPNLLGASAKLDVRAVKDVIALAKAKPGGLSYASSGIGTVFHLSGELFNLLAGIDTVHVPFKGLAAAYPEVGSGQIGLVYDSVISALPHIKAGRIRPLAMLGARRSALLPDVPTMAEAGVPGYDVTFWQALFAPPGTRAALVARINDEVNRSLRLPEVRDGFAAQGAEVFPGSPARLAALLEHDIALMGRLVRQAKVQPD